MAIDKPPPGPNAVENEEKLWLIKFVVEMKEEVREAEEIYPAEPNPVTVDVKLAIDKPPPGPNAVEKEEKLWLIKFVVEIKEDVKEAEEM